MTIRKLDPKFLFETINTMNEALLIVTPDKRIAYLNEKAEKLLGIELASVEGVLCTEAISCPNCECECRLFDEGEVVDKVVTIFHPKMAQPISLLKKAKVLRDKSGEVIGGIEVLTDISKYIAEQKDHESHLELLLREKRRTEALINEVSQGIICFDEKGMVTDFSSRAEKITGISRRAALGKRLCELLPLPESFVCEQPGKIAAGASDFNFSVGDKKEKPLRLKLSDRKLPRGETLAFLYDLSEKTPGAKIETSLPGFHGIISGSENMRRLFRLIENIASSDINVLIEGESGVGKELVARAIHQVGDRRNEPFYAVNCATFRGDLLLSELFGHEKGAFTGAVKSKPGKFEAVGGGTIFLDEISEIPIEFQAMLLRVLEERSFESVGGFSRKTFNARIISATNINLDDAVKRGDFREDLKFRLRVAPLVVPPLRERKEDIRLLANFFIKNNPHRRRTKSPTSFSREALDAMNSYHWPGNVRELKNMVDYLLFISEGEVQLSELPTEIVEAASGLLAERAAAKGREAEQTLAPGRPVAYDPEAAEIIDALETAKYRRAVAAELLGIDRSTLWRKMKKHSLLADQ